MARGGRPVAVGNSRGKARGCSFRLYIRLRTPEDRASFFEGPAERTIPRRHHCATVDSTGHVMLCTGMIGPDRTIEQDLREVGCRRPAQGECRYLRLGAIGRGNGPTGPGPPSPPACVPPRRQDRARARQFIVRGSATDVLSCPDLTIRSSRTAPPTFTTPRQPCRPDRSDQGDPAPRPCAGSSVTGGTGRTLPARRTSPRSVTAPLPRAGWRALPPRSRVGPCGRTRVSPSRGPRTLCGDVQSAGAVGSAARILPRWSRIEC